MIQPKYAGITAGEGDGEHGMSDFSTSPLHHNLQPTPAGQPSSTAWSKSSASMLWLLVVSITMIVLLVSIAWELSVSNSLLRSDSSSTSSFQTASLVSVDQPTAAESSSPSVLPFSLYHDPQQAGQLFIFINSSYVAQRTPFLWIQQVVHGLGDRRLIYDPGHIISQDLVHFRHTGRQIALTASTTSYRSATDLTERSFAHADMWLFDILKADENGYWVDGTAFALQSVGITHAADLPSAIRTAYGSQHEYALSSERSYLDLSRCKSNSLRSYFTSNLTYVPLASLLSPKHLDDLLPSGRIISIAVRSTFLTLAPSLYAPRLFHPKAGFNFISFMDEDAPLLASRSQQMITRHHLANHTLPLVYYIDPIIPADMRDALLEGIAWWDEAFQYAGYPKGSFVAQVAPADFDPYDFHMPRVHYVQWIDRDLRFYSLGMRITDPRTGEVLKGHVRLGALRMRQDALLLSALLSPYTSSGGMDSLLEAQINSAILQRVKHLGAHEVGHTLGLAHNFAGSSCTDGYASVMDYPPPLIRIASDGRLVVGNGSYSNSIGFFDKVAIGYGYKDFGPNDMEKAGLATWMAAAQQQGYAFVTDPDSELGGSDARSTKWDSGWSAVDALNESMVIRQVALQRFALQSIADGTSTSKLLELFPVVYLWHRFEVEATAKLLGGRTVRYDVRDDTAPTATAFPVSGALQRKAIKQLLLAVDPQQFAVPADVLRMGLAASFGFVPELGGFGDLFQSRQGQYSLDSIVLLESLASYIFTTVFEPSRMERMYVQAQYNHTVPSLQEIMRSFTDQVFAFDSISFNISWQEKHLQNVLLHAYISLQSVFSKCSYLVDGEVQSALTYIGEKLTAVLGSGACSGSAGVYEVYEICNHCRRLQVFVSGRKPFLSIFPLPDGPPI